MKVLKAQKISKGCDYSSPFTGVHGSISAEARMRMLTGDTFVFWPKGRCQVWRCSDQIFVAEISRRMGKSMEIDLIKNKCGREFFVGLIGRFAAF